MHPSFATRTEGEQSGGHRQVGHRRAAPLGVARRLRSPARRQTGKRRRPAEGVEREGLVEGMREPMTLTSPLTVAFSTWSA
jgi:hypothetical protein